MTQAIQQSGGGNAEVGIVAMAKMLAKSNVVPKHYQGDPANCLIAADYAQHMGEPVLAIMRATFIVHGALGFKAEFLIGRANSSGIFDAPITYEERGEVGKAGYAVRAGAPIKGKDYWGPWVTWEMVSAEGWLSNAKYKSMPEVMFRYRAATFFVRQTCPQVLSGAKTVEELEDMALSQPRDVEIDPAAQLNAAMRQAEEQASQDEAPKPEPVPVAAREETDEERAARGLFPGDVEPEGVPYD